MRSFFVAFFIYFLKYSTIFGCFPQPNISNDNKDDDTRSVVASDNLENFIRCYANEAWATEWPSTRITYEKINYIAMYCIYNATARCS